MMVNSLSLKICIIRWKHMAALENWIDHDKKGLMFSSKWNMLLTFSSKWDGLIYLGTASFLLW